MLNKEIRTEWCRNVIASAYEELMKRQDNSDRDELEDVKLLEWERGETEQLYRRLYQGMETYARETPCEFYGDNPTIWSQFKFDEKHGAPPMCAPFIYGKCVEELEKLGRRKTNLLWIYTRRDGVWSSPDEVDVVTDIANTITGDLYNAAGAENSAETEAEWERAGEEDDQGRAV